MKSFQVPADGFALLLKAIQVGRDANEKAHTSLAVEVIPGAAHITTWDNPEAMLRVVRRFLRKVDSRAGAPEPPESL